MADLSHLGGSRPVEPINLAEGQYSDQKESKFQLPAKGVYTLRAPDAFPATAFSRSRAGALMVQIDPTIVGPANEGFQLRKTRVSAKEFDRDGKVASQLGDYLVATGNTGTFANEAELADAAEATAGSIYEAELDWVAEHYDTKYKVLGMRRFPALPDGSRQSWVEHPSELGTDGKPLRLRANLVITRFIPARS